MLVVNVAKSDNLKKPLSKVTSAASKRTPMESCVLLEADAHDGLTLTAIDSHSHQLRMRIPESTTVNDGAVLLEGGTFNQLVSTLRDTDVNLAFVPEENQLFVQAGTKLQLPIFNEPVDKFPREIELPKLVCAVDAERLRESLDAAKGLCDKGEMIAFKCEGGLLHIYTKSKGVLFSRSTLECREHLEDFAISVPAAVFAHLPNALTGVAELRLNEELDKFAIACGLEHLLILQVANDNYSHTVDAMVDDQAASYWVVGTDALSDDLRRAVIFKDPCGIQLTEDGEFLVARCDSRSGKLKTPHRLEQQEGDPSVVHVDPAQMDAALKALEATSVVIEQLREVVPPAFEGDEEMTAINLRLKDLNAPGYRVITLGTLGV